MQHSKIFEIFVMLSDFNMDYQSRHSLTLSQNIASQTAPPAKRSLLHAL